MSKPHRIQAAEPIAARTYTLTNKGLDPVEIETAPPVEPAGEAEAEAPKAKKTSKKADEAPAASRAE